MHSETHTLHAEPDGRVHWADEEARQYQQFFDTFTSLPARDFDAATELKKMAGALKWRARWEPVLVREYVSEVRAWLHLAMRLHHPALFDLLLSVPGEDMFQRAWLEAFERWPLAVLRHALAWELRGSHKDEASTNCPELSRAQQQARLVDGLIAQALAQHPDWQAPLHAALLASDADATARQRFAAILQRSTPQADVAAPERWPELLRNPPWRRAQKATAQEKAAQPWLKLPARLPMPPLFVVAAHLPALRLADGGQAIGPQAVDDLLRMLMLGKPGAPWPGLAQVLPAFTPASLAEWGRALWHAWALAGASSEHKWMLIAQGTLGDADTLEALVKQIAVWPGKGFFHLAKHGLLALGEMGARPDAVGEDALRALIRFAEKGKPSLRQPARAQAEAAAARLGLSPDTLADRLVPDLGLNSAAAFRFDLGERVHTLHFDENLLPFVRDADGKRLKDLPKARVDDGDCTDTVARWKALKKAAKTLASEQIARLENALMSGRVWQRDDFERLFMQHPLLRELGRRVLWVARTPDADVLLRIAEDFTLLDADDAPVTLPAMARLSLAHPIDLDAATLARWGQLWADYGLLPPFPQLGRPVFRLGDAEIAQPVTLARCAGWELATGSVLGLLNKHGWQRLSDGAHVYGLRLPLGENVAAVLMLEEGFDIAEPHATPTQVIERFGFEGATSARQRSEALYALEGCRAGGSR